MQHRRRQNALRNYIVYRGILAWYLGGAEPQAGYGDLK